jgi:AraC-like DNA-binding protein
MPRWVSHGSLDVMKPKQPSPPDTIRFVSLASWIKAAAICRISPEPLLREVGLFDALKRDPTPTIHVDVVARLMLRGTELAWPDHYFPIVVGEQFAFDHMPALETFLATAATPRCALAGLVWVGRVFPHMRIELVEEGGEAALLVDTTVQAPHHEGMALLVERDMAAIRRFARTMIGDAAVGRRVELRHAPRPEVVALIERYYGVAVRCRQKRNALVFSSQLLDMPSYGAMPLLHDHVRDQVARLLPPPAEAPVQEVLIDWFRREPAWLVRPMQDVATRLQMHPRTLQRRLSEAGLTYAAVRDGCRQTLAMEALSAAQCVDDIAERLGFSDRTSFNRAFKRWTGLTPAAWRRAASS